ncbi:MAG: hypothetical protein MAGBODY4_00001 [Candidatus Marinimicrobia bacterium]|nr:hypothetical protein [Candidatus Neomarinimicrobiota bacterium]
MNSLLSYFRKNELNEYGYKRHEHNKSFFRQDNPWLYVLIAIGGLGISYVLVNLTMM